MRIREATGDDWPAIWRFMRRIVAAGETYAWATDLGEEEARALWLPRRGRTVVAVDDGEVLGSAMCAPNHGGGGAHVANAAFMVDPDRASRGVGRALAEHVIEQARRDGYRAMQFNAVVETNAPAVALWRSLGFEVLGPSGGPAGRPLALPLGGTGGATVPEGFRHPVQGYVGLHIMHRRL